MGLRSGKLLVIAVVLLHSVLIAGYTFPTSLVPERLQILGQWYARPLFHQVWKLFAPDPPLCSCVLEARVGQGAWQHIDRIPQSYLQRRSVQNLARYVQAEVHSGDTVPDAVLLRAMRSNFFHSSEAEPLAPEFRLVEHCITDPLRPSERELRITQLRER